MRFGRSYHVNAGQVSHRCPTLCMAVSHTGREESRERNLSDKRRAFNASTLTQIWSSDGGRLDSSSWKAFDNTCFFLVMSTNDEARPAGIKTLGQTCERAIVQEDDLHLWRQRKTNRKGAAACTTGAQTIRGRLRGLTKSRGSSL